MAHTPGGITIINSKWRRSIQMLWIRYRVENKADPTNAGTSKSITLHPQEIVALYENYQNDPVHELLEALAALLDDDNARLIAAAPELLEALRECVKMIEGEDAEVPQIAREILERL